MVKFTVALVLVFFATVTLANSPSYNGNWKGTYGPYGETFPKGSYDYDQPSPYEYRGKPSYAPPQYGSRSLPSYGYNKYETPKSYGSYY
ncbi:hypothetical protein DAPPUDRAFT_313879 [Daphnia pulex]|uniref:Uncharacterized protein n=1 Tax=Daphnia pulex TaxID=6669 RepID=E9G5J8_DAPPU|nr:hypothetical protein DAPPUDRAFT_313879 [Daphnia pulex]|eukprot:EFX85618.1 hypothetical protein DAPPUDRAFT_313879 [Daphnia pulex]